MSDKVPIATIRAYIQEADPTMLNNIQESVRISSGRISSMLLAKPLTLGEIDALIDQWQDARAVSKHTLRYMYSMAISATDEELKHTGDEAVFAAFLTYTLQNEILHNATKARERLANTEIVEAGTPTRKVGESIADYKARLADYMSRLQEDDDDE